MVIGDDYGNCGVQTFGTVTQGSWYHIVYAWDTEQGLVRGWLNGALSFDTYNSTFPTVMSSFSVGVGYGTRYWYGLIDDVRIYNRMLTSDEAALIYNTYK